jgi:diguanylate cyclase (GGDEF)-like protein
MSRGFATGLAQGSAPLPANPTVADLICAYAQVRSDLTPIAAALLEQALALAEVSQHQLHEQQSRIREFENLSVTDPLTGLLNRRGFQEAMERTLAACRRHGEDGVLAYIDLDGFKQINDSFGHGAGDAMLKHVAMLLTRTVRATDYIARLGGDEFAVIFTNTASEACKPILGKLRRLFNGSMVRIEDRLIHVRASIGTEVFSQATEFGALLSAADRDMYRAKQRRTARAA